MFEISGERENQDSTLGYITSLSPSLAKKSEFLNQEISKEKFSFTPLRKNSRSSMNLYKTIRLEEDFAHDHLKDLRLQDKQKSILAHLVLEESRDTKEFPNSFKVAILMQDTHQLEMIFYVPSSLFEFDSNGIQANFSQDQTLDVFFKERKYRIDLSQNLTQAVLVK